MNKRFFLAKLAMNLQMSSIYNRDLSQPYGMTRQPNMNMFGDRYNRDYSQPAGLAKDVGDTAEIQFPKMAQNQDPRQSWLNNIGAGLQNFTGYGQQSPDSTVPQNDQEYARAQRNIAKKQKIEQRNARLASGASNFGQGMFDQQQQMLDQQRAQETASRGEAKMGPPAPTPLTPAQQWQQQKQQQMQRRQTLMANRGPAMARGGTYVSPSNIIDPKTGQPIRPMPNEGVKEYTARKNALRAQQPGAQQPQQAAAKPAMPQADIGAGKAVPAEQPDGQGQYITGRNPSFDKAIQQQQAQQPQQPQPTATPPQQPNNFQLSPVPMTMNRTQAKPVNNPAQGGNITGTTSSPQPQQSAGQGIGQGAGQAKGTPSLPSAGNTKPSAGMGSGVGTKPSVG